MGLGDLSPDEGNGGGSRREYTQITREDFEEFLDTLDSSWQPVDVPGTGEIVYQSKDFAPSDDNIVLLIYSTIDRHRGVSRGKGSDAIRLVAHHKAIGKPISGRRKTLRIKTWRKNLREKIEDMMGNESEVIRKCTACGTGYMVKREGKFGEFLGCTQYPGCQNTVNID